MYSGLHRKDRYEYIISDLTRGAKKIKKEKKKERKKHFRPERIMFCRECFSPVGSQRGGYFFFRREVIIFVFAARRDLIEFPKHCNSARGYLAAQPSASRRCAIY